MDGLVQAYSDGERNKPNHSMESAASPRHNLLLVSLNTYPVALPGFARGDSSWSR
jgi:hypothetical protein